MRAQSFVASDTRKERSHGPLRLADSVRWNSSQAEPYFVSNSGDTWNTVLSTMALIELLDHLEDQPSGSEFFALLGEVCSALHEVFLAGATADARTSK